MELLKKNIRPRDIMTKEALINALTVDMALGCSTNSMLHLPAIAHEIGMDLRFPMPMNQRQDTEPVPSGSGRSHLWKISMKPAASTQ